MHTNFDTVGTQYAVARRRLGHQVVYTVHAAEELVARVVVDIRQGLGLGRAGVASLAPARRRHGSIPIDWMGDG